MGNLLTTPYSIEGKGKSSQLIKGIYLDRIKVIKKQ